MTTDEMQRDTVAGRTVRTWPETRDGVRGFGYDFAGRSGGCGWVAGGRVAALATVRAEVVS